MPEPDPETPDGPATTGEPSSLQVAGKPDEPGKTPTCNSAFRRTLLGKLPMLGYLTWKVKDSFQLDDKWSAIVSVNADAVLEPLETVVADRLAPDPPLRSKNQ